MLSEACKHLIAAALPQTLNITRDKLKTTVLRGGHGLRDGLLEAAERRERVNARKLKVQAKGEKMICAA